MPTADQVSVQSVLTLDGKSWVELPPECVPPGNEITISMWLYGDDSLPAGGGGVFGTSDAAKQRLICICVPWKDTIHIDTGGNLKNRLQQKVRPADYKGRWSHWAFVKNSKAGRLQVYLDGQLFHELKGMHLPIHKASAAGLGTNVANEYNYRGRMSEVRIWDKARTQQEIQQDLHRRLTGKEPHLFAYWPLNEGQGTVVHDRTPRGNHGTIHGAHTWSAIEVPLETPPVVSAPRVAAPDIHGPGDTGLAEFGYWLRWRKTLPQQPAEKATSARRGRIWA